MEADEYFLGTSKDRATLPASAPTREPSDSHRSNKTLHTTEGDKMLTRSTNEHMAEQTSRHIMQSAGVIISLHYCRKSLRVLVDYQQITRCFVFECLRHGSNL